MNLRRITLNDLTRPDFFGLNRKVYLIIFGTILYFFPFRLEAQVISKSISYSLKRDSVYHIIQKNSSIWDVNYLTALEERVKLADDSLMLGDLLLQAFLAEARIYPGKEKVTNRNAFLRSLSRSKKIIIKEYDILDYYPYIFRDSLVIPECPSCFVQLLDVAPHPFIVNNYPSEVLGYKMEIKNGTLRPESEILLMFQIARGLSFIPEQGIKKDEHDFIKSDILFKGTLDKCDSLYRFGQSNYVRAFSNAARFKIFTYTNHAKAFVFFKQISVELHTYPNSILNYCLNNLGLLYSSTIYTKGDKKDWLQKNIQVDDTIKQISTWIDEYYANDSLLVNVLQELSRAEIHKRYLSRNNVDSIRYKQERLNYTIAAVMFVIIYIFSFWLAIKLFLIIKMRKNNNLILKELKDASSIRNQLLKDSISTVDQVHLMIIKFVKFLSA